MYYILKEKEKVWKKNKEINIKEEKTNFNFEI